MPRTAKVFMTNRSQAVRLPKEFQFATDEVLIRKVGDDVILSPRARDWKIVPGVGAGGVRRPSWPTLRTCPSRNENSDAALHAGHGHVLLHHEALASPRAEAPAGRCRSTTSACPWSRRRNCCTASRCRPAGRTTPRALAAFLPYVEAVDLDRERCRSHYAEIRADLKRRGALIGANDLFIAAHARALGLTLVTNNTAEFERVRDLASRTGPSPRRRK